MTGMMTAPMQGTQMIDRTVSLMRLVATYCPKGARLTDLAEESGLPAPTARRILKRLVDHGLVAQDHVKHRYTVGHLAFELGLSANHLDREAALYRPLVEALAEATGHTIYLLLRSGLDVVCIDRLDAQEMELEPTLRVGDRLPLGVGVGGLALLAALPEDEAEAVIEANRPVYRRFVRTTGSNFREHLEDARLHGHTIRRSPVTPGIVGFGMALPCSDGRPTVAISLAAKARSIAEARRAETVATMRRIIAEYQGSTA